jgi:hypothetical protein
MKPPPDWMAERVKVHFDSVMISLELPYSPSKAATAANVLAAFILGVAVIRGDTTTAFLALVVWVIGRVLLTPPHRGMLAWAKICPGRRRAEYHSLDQTSHVYRRRDVPYQRLMVTIVRRTTHYRIEIAGFPREATPVLLRTRDLREAKRCAREAGAWLELPIAA